MSDAKAGQRPSRHPKPAAKAPAEARPADAAGRRQAARPKHTGRARPTCRPPRSRRSRWRRTTAACPRSAPLDLAVEPGESVVLIGHNGSGKTTLLRMVAGLLEPTDGQRARPRPRRRLAARPAPRSATSPTTRRSTRTSRCGSTSSTSPACTAWSTGSSRPPTSSATSGSTSGPTTCPVQFSRGLRQKASIAIGLIRPFGVLLVDEPFVGLDAAGKAALLELLDDAHSEGATLVVATHELEFVQRVAALRRPARRRADPRRPAAGIDVLALVS